MSTYETGILRDAEGLGAHATHDDSNEAERRLGLIYINTASHGVKSYLGKIVEDGVALLLFDKPSTGVTIASLWELNTGQSITSEDLQFSLGMLWDWDWRAELVEKAFERLLATRTLQQDASAIDLAGSFGP